MPVLARGTRVELEILRTDEVDLSIEARVTAIIEEIDDPALLAAGTGEFEEETSSA
jgi:hypothetical protein